MHQNAKSLPASKSQSDEKQLIERARAGDLDAYGLLYDEYGSGVYNLVLRMLGNAEDAEDVRQEVFLKAHRSLKGFKGEARFSTWLYRIATNVCLDEIRRRKPAASIEQMGEDGSWEPVKDSSEGHPEQELGRKLSQEAVQAALSKVAPHYRVLIVLRHLEDRSYEEIAAIVGCSVNSLNVRLHRAREAFRKALTPYLSEDSHGDLPSGPKTYLALY
ncbi:MAG: sigma-70 family RNA polymerase sigma factor [Armatimonadetes bacterium]|nr:sigma-70 family RNA polymerase sigma factor [Armatimonadota bacterium]